MVPILWSETLAKKINKGKPTQVKKSEPELKIFNNNILYLFKIKKDLFAKVFFL
jgi:hypothetical protein